MKNMLSSIQANRASLTLLIGLNLVVYLLMQLPILSLLMTPLDIFVTTLHESGHAVACYLTGGHVTGLTIVSDAAAHAAGITWCRGSNSAVALYSAGYLGAAFMGCVMIWLGRDESKSRVTLQVLGVSIAIVSLYVMMHGFFNRIDTWQVTQSIALGVGMAVALVAAGRMLSPNLAHLFLLVLGGQTALNALHDIFGLVKEAFGFHTLAGMSDASFLAQSSGIPAGVWSVLWGIIAVAMLFYTLKWCYGKSGSSGK